MNNLTWQVGDVKVTRVVEIAVDAAVDGPIPFMRDATPAALREMPWLYPYFVTDADALKLSFHALLVDAPGLKLVVDTCLGNDKPRHELGGSALHTNFLEDIAAAGFARESVNAVVCTHLHVDHVGWNTMLQDGKWVPTFPNARYLMSRADYEHWIKSDEEQAPAIMADSVTPVLEAGLVQLVELDHRISPELRLIPTTGHTPGHVSVLIESRGETAVITGDMMHHPCQIARPDWSVEQDSDKKASAVTRRAMLKDWADKPILIIGTHFAAPTAGHIVRDGASYRLKA
jgi:glyoxylase-like metal-dependent hydrolase (beta-lactamase superfamily II)